MSEEELLSAFNLVCDLAEQHGEGSWANVPEVRKEITKLIKKNSKPVRKKVKS